MKPAILIDEVRFWEEIKKMEEERDEHPSSSSEYIELDEKITTVLSLFSSCKIVKGFSIIWED